MDHSAYVKMIKKLGLCEYEAKCYLALFERQSLTVGEISKLASIPRTSTYEALDKLMAKGLAVSIPGETKRYSASDPTSFKGKSLEVFDDLLEIELEEVEKRKKEILDRKKSIQSQRDIMFDELVSTFNKNRTNGNPLDYIEILKNPEQIHRKFVELNTQAKKEVLAFIKPPFAFDTEFQEKTRAFMLEQFQSDTISAQTGVVTRNIKEMETVKRMNSLADKYDLTFTANQNIKGRVTDKLPIKMVIFDRRYVLFHLNDPIEGNPSMTCLVAEHSDLAKAFVDLFEYHWEKAIDLTVINNHIVPQKGKQNRKT
jgi:HTH-type transcriptional regulator, sugar sensing transcriptional regulator